ncbi:hypothetical protein II898_01830 [bacterium]|nr:hypothetical protein [bacterium]
MPGHVTTKLRRHDMTSLQILT